MAFEGSIYLKQAFKKANTEQIKNDAIMRNKSGEISDTFHAEMDNGYYMGYEMLHVTAGF